MSDHPLKHSTPEAYAHGSGTINIAGRTTPGGAASCALHFLSDPKIKVVEFLSIGANAGQQAAKAMACMRDMFLSNPANEGADLCFIPRWCMTDAREIETGEIRPKTCLVWRAAILRS